MRSASRTALRTVCWSWIKPRPYSRVLLLLLASPARHTAKDWRGQLGIFGGGPRAVNSLEATARHGAAAHSPPAQPARYGVRRGPRTRRSWVIQDVLGVGLGPGRC